MPIEDIIDQNAGTVFTMDSSLTIEDAIHLMVEKETTGIIVMENDRPVGIFTEKDVVLFYARSNHRPFSEVFLKDAMTQKLIVARPEDDIDTSISLMIKAGIKHLPVWKTDASQEFSGYAILCNTRSAHYQANSIILRSTWTTFMRQEKTDARHHDKRHYF